MGLVDERVGKAGVGAGPGAPAYTYGPVDVLLADGRIATLRSPGVDDEEELTTLHREVDASSLRLRFFSADRQSAERYAAHLARCDDDRVLAIVGIVDGRMVGVASCEVVGPGTGEVAFLVADDTHGRGLGTLLLEHLAAFARTAGIVRFTAEVLVANSEMLRLFAACGFTRASTTEAGVTTLELSTAATARAIAAADEREARAEAESLRPLLAPRSVAVVGVRRGGGGVGNAVLDQLHRGGYGGEVLVIHPDLGEMGSTPVFADLASVGHPVDLVVVAVPAEHVVQAVRDAAEAGARAAVVLSSGLGEAGADGRDRQRELVRIARRHSMRVVGPNCLGLMNPWLHLNATFAGELPPAGGVALASQSGGVGVAVLEQACRSGLGVAAFVSLGNKADVSGNDLLAAWYDDPRVRVGALYLESFGNPLKFARLARRFALRKPLLAIAGGRSDSGRRAGLSHTAAAAAPSVGIDALFAHAGVIACPGIDTLVDVARLLNDEPLPRGPRLAVLGNAGGLGVLAADAAEREGLVVEPLPADVAQEVADAAGVAAAQNPVDLGAGVAPEGLLGASRVLLRSEEVDALLLVLVGTSASQVGSFLGPLVQERTGLPDKPVLVVAFGGLDLPDGLVGFGSVDAAAAALARVARYATWRAAQADDEAPEEPGEEREVAAAVLDHGGGSRWLRLDEAGELLSAYGIRGANGAVVAGADAAARAARDLGFPVAVKAADPRIVHRTERGLVRTGLTSAAQVRRAVHALAEELGSVRPEVVVQPMVSGVEMAVGIVRDPGFGPLVMVAAGGVAIDVWSDRTFLLPPITRRDAEAAVRSLRVWPLLNGFRGAPAVDVAALVDLVTATGRMARDLPQVAELDLNPVVVTTAGAVWVDAKIRVDAGAVTQDAGVPRRLREPV